MGKIIQYLKAFIPQHIHNGIVVYVFSCLSRCFGSVPRQKIFEHAAANRMELTGSPRYLQKGLFIENQAEWGSILFGEGKKSNISYSGCGIIATYNALTALGEPMSPEIMIELISDFERKGAVWRGRFGVAPKMIYDYFIRRQYDSVWTVTKDMDYINEIGRNYDVMIVTAYNNKQDITAQIHTVCISKEADGAYVIHNAFHKQDGKWEPKRTGQYALGEAIVRIGICAAAVCVIGVNRK